MASTEPEPKPLSGAVQFEEWDFAALSPAHERDPEWNERRLNARRRLLTLAKAAAKAFAANGLKLDVRTSLHNPHAFNGKRVRRLWAYLMRGKLEKTRLRKVLGRDLAKDLDSAFRNAYLCLAIEHDRLEVSLRIHPDAWYDGQNLKNRIDRQGVQGWLEQLRDLEGFQLRLHDWKGEWRGGSELRPEQLEEFLRFWTPGEHQLVVDKTWPVPAAGPAREAALGEGVGEELVRELTRLVPLYRFTAWSEESDHLFSS
ncbi:MAG: hypothetical protein O2816_13150 [Planctomycetota bacterium]|nr:hypothetical protein [Planctomycetota bacterium]